MSEIKDFGATLDDNMSVNKVETALDTIGVKLFDTNGLMRDLDDVLMETGQQWSGLNKNQQAYIATALAGTRQQTRLLSVFSDFDRTMELVTISENSAGATMAQHADASDSLASALARLQNVWQKLIASFTQSGIVTGAISTIASLLDAIPVGLITTVGAITLLTGAVAQAIIVVPNLITGLQGLMSGISGLVNGGKVLSDTTQGISNIGSIISNAYSAVLKGSKISKAALEAETAAKVVDIAVTEADTAATTSLASAKMLANSGAIVLTASILAAVAVIALAVGIYDALTTSVKESTKAIQDFSNENYELNKQSNDIKSLADQYQAIHEKLILTNEDLEEMRRIKAQILAMDSGASSIFTTDGIDSDKLDAYQKALDAEIRANKKEAATSGQNIIDQNGYKNLPTEESTLEAMGLATAETVELQIDWDSNASIDSAIDIGKQMVDAIAKVVADNPVDFVNPYNYQYQQSNYSMNFVDPTEAAQTSEEITAELTDFFNEQATNLENLADESRATQVAAADALEAAADTPNKIKAIEEMTSSAKEFKKEANLLGLSYDTLQSSLENTALSTKDLTTVREKLIAAGYKEQDVNTLIGRSLTSSATTVEELAKEIGMNLKTATADSTNALLTMADALGILNSTKLDTLASTFYNTQKDLDTFSGMLMGTEDFNATNFEDVITTISGLSTAENNLMGLVTSDMVEYGKISQATSEAIAQANRDAVKTKLEDTITAIELEIKGQENQLAAYEQILNTDLTNTENYAKAETMITGEQKAIQLGVAYDYAKADIALAQDTYDAKAAIISGQEFSGLKAQYDAGIQANSAANLAKMKSASDAARSIIETEKSATEAQLKLNQDKLAAYKIAVSQLSAGVIMASSIVDEAAEDAASSMDDATDAAEAYEAKLNDIYIATKKLAQYTQMNDIFSALAEYSKEDDGEVYANMQLKRVDALKKVAEMTTNLITLQKAEQKSLVDGLDPAYQSSAKVFGNKVIPVMSEYNKLTDEGKESVDTFAEAFNGLSDEIDSNTSSLIDNATELKEIEQDRRDMFVELEGEIIDSIKAQWTDAYDTQKEALEKEKELLKDRKALYEDAFSDQDYADSESDLTKEREDIISQIAKYAGGTDTTSRKRLANLQADLVDINDQYNELVTTHYQDSLTEQIDASIDAKDEELDLLEEAFNEKIDNYQLLEDTALAIIKQGQEAIVNYLIEWNPSYQEQLAYTKEDTVAKWTAMATSIALTEGKLDNISTTSAALATLILADNLSMSDSYSSLQGYVGALTTSYNAMAAAAKAAAEAAASSGTKTNKDPYVDTTIYGSHLTGLGVDASNNDDYQNNYMAGVARAAKLVKAAKTKSDMATQHSANNSLILRGYAKGGYVDTTGPVMVHGTPSSPEAFLSAKDTANFEYLKKALNNNLSNITNQSEMSIGAINITTASMNSNQDFKKAGQLMADSFRKAYSERGINKNLKK